MIIRLTDDFRTMLRTFYDQTNLFSMNNTRNGDTFMVFTQLSRVHKLISVFVNRGVVKFDKYAYKYIRGINGLLFIRVRIRNVPQQYNHVYNT